MIPLQRQPNLWKMSYPLTDWQVVTYQPYPKNLCFGAVLASIGGHMKLNFSRINKLALLSVAVCAAMLAFSHNASANRVAAGINTPATNLTFGDGSDLGQVISGIPSGDAQRTAYVNHLIDMVPGTTDVALGQTFHRSLNNPGPGFPNYPNAVFGVNGTGTTIDLGNGTQVLKCGTSAVYLGLSRFLLLDWLGNITAFPAGHSLAQVRLLRVFQTVAPQ